MFRDLWHCCLLISNPVYLMVDSAYSGCCFGGSPVVTGIASMVRFLEVRKCYLHSLIPKTPSRLNITLPAFHASAFNLPPTGSEGTEFGAPGVSNSALMDLLGTSPTYGS